MRTDRRNFLSRLVLGAAGFIAAAVTGLTGGYLFGGARDRPKDRWTPIVRLDTLEPNEPLHIHYLDVVPDAWATIKRRKSVWLVAREGSGVVAYDPTCTHLGCPYDWDPSKRVFLCPCHGGVFDISGTVLAGPPPRPLDRISLRIADGRVFLGSEELERRA